MTSELTRRDIGMLAGATALAASRVDTALGQTVSQPSVSPAVTREFPKDFLWGVGTSAYQIEGAPDADGKGKSIWDTYAHIPGKIRNGHTGDVANDHYRRYKEDVALIKSLGAKAYRFSIAWTRIFPDGVGQPNTTGIDFYSRLVDELLAAGIEPYPTLYHWDLPQALQDKGGWQSRDTAKAFGDYSAVMADRLSDRVKHFFTINEFFSFVDIGYSGFDVPGSVMRVEFAPGLRLSPSELNQVRHYAILAHGLAVQAIRASGRAGTKCGPAENLSVTVPVIDAPEHVKAAEIATRELNAAYLTAILEGKYTDAYLAAAGAAAPKFNGEDMKTISSPVDFVGINVYRPSVYVMASDNAPGFRVVPFNESHPKMISSWQMIGPEAMYWGPRLVQAVWGVKEIHIAENGCGASDVMSSNGEVYDSDRIMFMRNNLMQLQRATAEGVPVKSYFHWSLMDNFEWADGFATRFGLVHVDFETQKRTPKLSASYFREAAMRNAVV